MYHLYSIVLAGTFLCTAPIVAGLYSAQGSGGHSVHFKTVEEGVWPYPSEGPGGRAENAGLSMMRTGEGYWI
jgi:hypothetical protein